MELKSENKNPIDFEMLHSDDKHPIDQINYIDKYRELILELRFTELGIEDSISGETSVIEGDEQPIILGPAIKYGWNTNRKFTFYPVKGEPKHFLIEVESRIPMIRLSLQESELVQGRYPLTYWGLYNKEVIQKLIYMHDIF